MTKVAVAVIEKDGKILIARRKKGSYLEGKWEFPGGKIEHDETPEQCLKRELSEELGITVDIGDLIGSGKYDYVDLSVELLAYHAFFTSEKLIINVHEEVRWIRPDELKLYDFPEANKPIIDTLIKQFGK